MICIDIQTLYPGAYLVFLLSYFYSRRVIVIVIWLLMQSCYSIKFHIFAVRYSCRTDLCVQSLFQELLQHQPVFWSSPDTPNVFWIWRFFLFIPLPCLCTLCESVIVRHRYSFELVRFVIIFVFGVIHDNFNRSFSSLDSLTDSWNGFKGYWRYMQCTYEMCYKVLVFFFSLVFVAVGCHRLPCIKSCRSGVSSHTSASILVPGFYHDCV